MGYPTTTWMITLPAVTERMLLVVAACWGLARDILGLFPARPAQRLVLMEHLMTETDTFIEPGRLLRCAMFRDGALALSMHATPRYGSHGAVIRAGRKFSPSCTRSPA